MKKARFFKPLEGEKVKCLACQRYCEIEPGAVGFCQSRLNKNGELYSLNYGVLSSMHADPVEKKPLYHFHPGTEVLSFGSFGCNYRCKQCLNYSCSWGEQAKRVLQQLREAEEKDRVAPEEIVRLAVKKGIPGIAFTYNEPAIFPEYVEDAARLAKEKGLYTVYVTNGSWTEESLQELAPLIDAVNIDIKGFEKQTYQQMGAFFGDVLQTTEKVVNEYEIFTELTTLVIPGINDSQEELRNIAQWIAEELGREVPWHLSRFSPELAPDEDFQKLASTSVEKLREAYRIGMQAGLKHIYVWAPGSGGERGFSMGDTICPQCDKIVIERMAWRPEFTGVKERAGKAVCSNCGKELNLIRREK